MQIEDLCFLIEKIALCFLENISASVMCSVKDEEESLANCLASDASRAGVGISAPRHSLDGESSHGSLSVRR